MPRALLLLSLLLTACRSATPHAYVPPPPARVPLQLCWIDTGGVTVDGGFGTAGHARAKQWEVTSAALLVRHPKGDLLLDAGISPAAQAEARELGTWRRFVFDRTAGQNLPRRSLPEALAALGVTHLKAVLLSHAHPDHVGGAALLPGVPVSLAEPERALVAQELAHPRGVVVPAHARALAGRMVALPFTSTPYATYDQSDDVFGDGSVVVVPTYGHTPGSVATFLNVSPTLRLVHVGDLLNLQESVERHVGKSWVMRELTDEDGARTEAEVERLFELHRQDPGLVILPAHDKRAYEALFGPDTVPVPPCVGTPPAEARK
ncbi:MBL fold metallo-hydrolase [Aggregicoccus sp. 17bor-14]|uniref:MBL fold metallo-hydrolase n=1 Tax=Myxococcaceae TaxID=31 RepID=UPI00129C7051|nr:MULTISPECIES: MBL fold metallo-hydrolase [Myxococcaceae]MBF5044559.1 MBL fold metallo-hydrolase [Simulacricoccus sp. 17bor-14]MRI90304.1 MBL fold metallo-hydrolase [Aggregicoccus sp. 17bor-14]